ncbi:DUF6285 domain-containing protein [Pseudomonas japonica]|uniref:DUF6285 domain-containing protein n=1 Tax=Pseudomonas TaxID=286 RepID=UPI002927EEBA|nr:DUF6285 domain-containing protein [Pseudomonas sp. zfem002]MDU9390203.1 DUF6285 domain-containing protein [Pseudomonas sp. zfem002]
MTQPNACELLEIARQTLLEQVLPALSADLRYPTLMIANAMAIAARESRLQERSSSYELSRLAVLTDVSGASLQDARRQLARDIRAGRHDAVQGRSTLVEALRQVTVAQLAISNPKAMP